MNHRTSNLWALATSTFARGSRLAIAGGIISAFATAGGCGSDDAGSDQICTPGADTQECLGPGQCKGAQACAQDGKSFLPCECGSGTGGGSGSGGGAGSGGTGNGGSAGAGATGGGGGTGGAPPDGSAGSSGGGATGTDGGPNDGSADVEPDTAPGPLDDPCPTEPIYLNCSMSCGGRDSECSMTECPDTLPGFWINDANVFPTYVRTPANPGAISACKCSDGTVYGMVVKVNLQNTRGIRAFVDPPWKVLVQGWTTKQCVHSKGKVGCAYGNSPAPPLISWIAITTDDPFAPARNVRLEIASPGSTINCP